MLQSGREDSVAETRASFQGAISATFKAIVERATGRTVTSFLSNTSVGSLYSVEVFRLGTA